MAVWNKNYISQAPLQLMIAVCLVALFSRAKGRCVTSKWYPYKEGSNLS